MGPKLLAAVAALLLLLGACGNSDRPSESKLARAFAGQQSPLGLPVSDEQADCLADAYSGSGLSAKYLRALSDGRQPTKVSEDDRDELRDLSADVAKNCLK